MRRLTATEEEPLALASPDRALVRDALLRLTARLRPRRPFLRDDGTTLRVQNLVGVVRLADGSFLDVAPKVPAGADWISAVLDLLADDSRIDLAGSRHGGPAPPQHDLLDALATLYADHLEDALLREGPVQVIERQYDVLPMLKGKLGTGSYLRHVPLRMHRFPVSFDQLNADNDFSRGLAVAARLLAGATTSDQVRARLQRASTLLRPGLPDVHSLSPGAATRTLPTQWRAYRPAWSIACAVLQRSSLLGRGGNRHALEVAIEPWPLLEKLLGRALRAAATAGGTSIGAPAPFERTLLADPSDPSVGTRSVLPDGLLVEGERTLATFEAKYSRRTADGNWPHREHVFQALSTAAAFGAPLVVLVYPERFDPITWTVRRFAGQPAQLVAMGLDLYSYERGFGDEARGQAIFQLLQASQAPGSATLQHR